MNNEMKALAWDKLASYVASISEDEAEDVDVRYMAQTFQKAMQEVLSFVQSEVSN